VRIEVLNGVNLDVLGRRNPELYGGLSLDELETRIYQWARELGCTVRCRQTNHEGEYIAWCHELFEGVDGAIVNPAAWTHYSWAIRDALETAALPTVEVHLSDVAKREEWRHASVLDGLVIGTVSGKGPDGYREALEMIKEELGA
jgi:3-dehydroquinate dehydratase II